MLPPVGEPPSQGPSAGGLTVAAGTSQLVRVESREGRNLNVREQKEGRENGLSKNKKK
jgi:hypothetical protein